ncbi:MAG: deoxyguanosinetriphosphate triphosphohydrolase [Clostridia bacterium]|nr:deoxyguanosinetriphosphate triphosphohydrolase [Clostridia bacterium]
MKEKIFKAEEILFSPYATKSNATKGRAREEVPCEMRTEFQRDRDRIIYSKAFRRLKNKTQVFFSPDGDHYMTRLTHTLDVAQIARSIARSLSLNEDLAEAIALGHDLGHTPFGHSGERALNKLNPNGFKHNVQSLRVVDVLENDGEGLNLTYEVRDGILEHKKSGNPHTMEGKVVSLSDRIAYLNHDIEDAIRAKIICEEDLPKAEISVLGNTSRERINTMITSIYRFSDGKPIVDMESEIKEATESLRDFMFDKVYLYSDARKEEGRATEMISTMYFYFKRFPESMPDFYRGLIDEYGIDAAISDYISGMTDRYAVYCFEEIFVPKNFLLR